MILVFDTETTGLIDFKDDATAPHQPRIIQLGAILIADDGAALPVAIAQLNAYIQPDGWVVPPEVTAITGITTEQCKQRGIPIKLALEVFNTFKAVAKMRVAHNLAFDKIMIAREEAACGLVHEENKIPSFCTMQKSTDIIKLPPTEKMLAAGFKSFKKPTLQEAYIHFVGEPFSGAHDAMADVFACATVFNHLKSMEKAHA